MIAARLKRLLTVVTLGALPLAGQGAEVSVAVAANFSAPMKRIAQAFQADTGHKVNLSFGATGQFYAQIRNGAPFAILLAADDKTPAKLEAEGLAVRGSAFTYAIGRLVLWSKRAGLIDGGGEILRTGRFDRIAIANPKLAPYGAAAMQVLDNMGLVLSVTPKIVEGANISQTFQFVASENASIGFVALSQVFEDNKIREGSGWIVPQTLHSPIKQDAVLLKSGQGNPAAEALMQYLRGDTVKALIRSFGYAR